MKYKDIYCGEFFGFWGHHYMKIDDGGSVIVKGQYKGTIIDFDPDEEVIPVNCEMKFTKRKE